jgi:hypothetical protein
MRARAGDTLTVCDEEFLALTEDAFNRVYFRAQVLGPFPGAIVGHELFASLADTRHELWSYLVDVGEASRGKRMVRTPLQLSDG